MGRNRESSSEAEQPGDECPGVAQVRVLPFPQTDKHIDIMEIYAYRQAGKA